MRVLGPRLGSGRTSEVFALGEDSVVKVLRPGTPARWARLEADVTAAVHRTGLPTPGVREITSIDGQEAIVFERIKGLSMWQKMTDEPASSSSLAMVMADVQRAINDIEAPAELLRLRDRVATKIEEAQGLDPLEREAAKELADSLAPGTKLCHGDLHPGNILMSDKGPVVIDWFDAAAGNRLADVARTSLLIRPSTRATTSPPHLPGAERAMLSEIHENYLRRILGPSSDDHDDLLKWERVLAASRLAEHAQASDAELLVLWRSESGSTPLSEALNRFGAMFRR